MMGSFRDFASVEAAVDFQHKTDKDQFSARPDSGADKTMDRQTIDLGPDPLPQEPCGGYIPRIAERNEMCRRPHQFGRLSAPHGLMPL